LLSDEEYLVLKIINIYGDTHSSIIADKMGYKNAEKILKSLIQKGMVTPILNGVVITEKGRDYLRMKTKF